MKLRNFANRFLLVALLALLCCVQSCVPATTVAVSVATAETETNVAEKTYYLDQYQANANDAGKNLYDTLGIKDYHQYLAELDANPATKLEEVVIAVVDTGVDKTHALFDGRILEDYAMDFSQGVSNKGVPASTAWYQDHNGHGTHVAGVIADTTLANVKILPIKIFYGLNNNSVGLSFENAVRYISALKNGKQVYLYNDNGRLVKTPYNQDGTKLNIVAVNLSLGSPGYDVSDNDAMSQYDIAKYQTTYGAIGYQVLINEFLAADILPIVAAGNVNTSRNEDSYTTYYSLPGACDGVLAVSAYDNTDNKNNQYHLASFSYHNDYVSVAAPGVQIWSACSSDIVDLLDEVPQKNIKLHIDQSGEYYQYVYSVNNSSTTWYVRRDNAGNYYLRDNGTSMATPFVTACYALLISDTGKTAAEDYGLPAWGGADKNYMTVAHKALLAAAATYGDQGEKGYDEYFGYGVVSLRGFVPNKETGKVATLTTIENVIPSSTLSTRLPNTDSDVTDWMAVVCILLLGVILVWGINFFRAYLHRRNTYDSESESEE